MSVLRKSETRRLSTVSLWLKYLAALAAASGLFFLIFGESENGLTLGWIISMAVYGVSALLTLPLDRELAARRSAERSQRATEDQTQ